MNDGRYDKDEKENALHKPSQKNVPGEIRLGGLCGLETPGPCASVRFFMGDTEGRVSTVSSSLFHPPSVMPSKRTEDDTSVEECGGGASCRAEKVGRGWKFACLGGEDAVV